MIERMPERLRTPAVARVATSPSALLLAGMGASVAVLAGLPAAAVAAVGAVAWAGRVALAVPRRRKGERIDPFAVGEPWRRFVSDALKAQTAFDGTVRRAIPGPIRDHLAEVARRIDEGVSACWRIARQGDSLENGLRSLDVEGTRRELAELADERRRQCKDPDAAAALARAEEAVRAQLASAERIGHVAGEARNRLRVLNAQLDEAVARAVELSLHTGDARQLRPLTDDVDSLVNELEALRQALEETGDQGDGQVVESDP